ncbi:MAG: putative DNA modification/repair radical SAM protein [Planctomycetota bacterium]
MDSQRKLAILADAAKYDASCASSGSKGKRSKSTFGNTEGMGICHSYTPDGRCVSLLKILLTNHCIYDCQYCINRKSSGTRRARFSVEEIVQLTIAFYRRNYIEGLFLSSGIIRSPDYTMEQLVMVARALREDHRYGGYIHLKTIPNASEELIEQAGSYADRLSVNVELPTESDLAQLAPEKKQSQIAEAMSGIRSRIDEYSRDKSKGMKPPRFVPAGQSTQMIVGATSTPDSKVLSTASQLYETHQLRRVYYSAYSPIPDSHVRLPGKSPPLIREHRLYQADWLLRFYGFKADEITTGDDQNLSLDIDPKTAWALGNRGFFPVDINTAPKEALLRIPGIGLRNVKRILASRRHHRLRTDDLQKLKVAWKRARAFVVTADHNPSLSDLDRTDLRKRVKTSDRQMMLFDAHASASSGEV